MEKELNRDEAQPHVPAPSNAQLADRLEIAHVLFMDLVAFSTWPMEEQRQGLRDLQEIVRNAQARAWEDSGRLIRLPTGDGMALVFFGDLIACLECALEISAALRGSRLKLRMGINSGPVFRVADINTNLNVAGGGINAAQRIMDAGDAGHILVSKSTAEVLLQLKDWAGHLHDLGEHRVKHGVALQFYNLCTSELGNPAIPSRFEVERLQVTKRRRRRYAAAIAAVLVLAVGLVAASRLVPEKRRSVAVLGFRNITARHEADWVSTGLAEGLRTQLANTAKLRTISGEESTEMRKDLGLTELDSMGKSTLGRLHDRGADIVIVGSYTDLPDKRIHLNVEIQDTAEGETIYSVAADGTEGEISQLVSETGQRVRAKMGLGQISPEKERQIALAQPSPEAAQDYSEGLAELRAYEPLQARSFLQKAIISDQAFPFAHAWLAEAWLILGHDTEAKDEAKKAFDLSKNLSFEDQTSIEGRYRAIATQWPAAINAYQQLFNHFPDNLDYGLKLAEVQRSAGRGREGLLTLNTLRKLPRPQGADPRIDLEEAETAAALGDLKRGLTVASQAARTAKATGARLLESRSLIWSCVADRHLGLMEQGKADCEAARKIAVDLGDKLGEARAVNNLASILSDQGDLDGAKAKFEEALTLGREIGDQRDVSGALNNIGNVLSGQGQLSQAREHYEEALKIQHQIGFAAEIPNTLNMLADALHQQGNLAAAQSTFEEAIATAQQSGNETAEAGSRANLGSVLCERGDLGAAEQNCRQALTIMRKRAANSDTAATLDILAELQVARGDLAGAEQSYREAMSLQDGQGEKGFAAVSRLGLATIFLERGDAVQAEPAARQSAEEFRAEKDSSNEAMARVVLTEALLAQARIPEAEREFKQAAAFGNNASQRDLRFRTWIASARLSVALGGDSNVRRAMETLAKTTRDAQKAGMPGSELEARLAIGEIELAHGRNSLGRTDLMAVQDKANGKGFLLIAKKAANAYDRKLTPAN